MTDWSDEVKARLRDLLNVLEAGYAVIECRNAPDIRAALAEIERLREACIRKDCDYGLEIRHLREAVREIRGRALASRGRDVGKVEARARLDCIAEAARAALRGGGESQPEEVPLDSPDHRPKELDEFAARGFERINRGLRGGVE